MKKYKAYVSHSIRGKLGINATPESMARNNEKAHEAVVLMRRVLPEINFYVPGEHDELISLLYQDKRVTEEDILWADCQIIERSCSVLIVYTPDGFISAGMETELCFAREHNIPRFFVGDAYELQRFKPRILKYLSEKK